jgi:hypothetical protein
MATVDALGNFQPEPGDILPREVARKEDDSPEVVALIEELNPTIKTAEDLAEAVEKVDALRRQLADETNEDNPHIAPSVNEAADESEASKPQPSKLGQYTIKSPIEK